MLKKAFCHFISKTLVSKPYILGVLEQEAKSAKRTTDTFDEQKAVSKSDSQAAAIDIVHDN